MKASTVQTPIYPVFISGPAPRNFETSSWGYKTYDIGNMNAGHWPSMARPPRTADRRTGPPEGSGFDPSNLKPAVGTRQTDFLTVSARSRHWLIARKRAFAVQLFVYGNRPKPTVLRAAGTGGCGLWPQTESGLLRHALGEPRIRTLSGTCPVIWQLIQLVLEHVSLPLRTSKKSSGQPGGSSTIDVRQAWHPSRRAARSSQARR